MSALSVADRRAHEAGSYVRTTSAAKPGRTVVARFPAGAPRGSWPAEEFAARLRRDGRQVDVVMDLRADAFLVVEAADDHSRPKEPLPQRPRGPHPYRSAP